MSANSPQMYGVTILFEKRSKDWVFFSIERPTQNVRVGRIREIFRTHSHQHLHNSPPNFPWLNTLPRQLLMPLAGVGLSLALRHAGVFPDGDALPPLGVYRGCMAAWQCGHATPGLFFKRL